ncbi:uncharacterized protein BDZ99DRAFT_233191 [Mytilinidion resinicola]|uniref:Uncharacterized protein n=1 Tax=Mytilinidion resinicola TaxID=574789 RepID=A0A6A6YZ56_9PEZI|nr:uncharacterized protein BDZ99DRAFT_233191 [Mytilinidion resinicola]KAF2814202.1 hypothetical protein BDZ99DRAFT_233191 [Mytilinidion resinicola]
MPVTHEYILLDQDTVQTAASWQSYFPHAHSLMTLQSSADTINRLLPNTQASRSEILVAPLARAQPHREALRREGISFELDSRSSMMQRIIQSSTITQRPALNAFEHYLNKTLLTAAQKESILVKQREIATSNDNPLGTFERYIIKPIIGPLTSSAPKELPSETQHEISTTPSQALDDPSDPSIQPQPNKFEQQIARLIYNSVLAKVESWEAETAAGKSLSEIWDAERAERAEKAARKRVKRYSRHSNKIMDKMDPRVHRLHSSSPCPNEDCTESPPSMLSTFKTLFGTIKEWSKVPRIRWGCYLMSTLVVPIPIPGVLLVLEAVQWGGWQVWDDEFWDAMVELMMGQVEEERGTVEQTSMLLPPLESLKEEDEIDEEEQKTSMVSPPSESLIVEGVDEGVDEVAEEAAKEVVKVGERELGEDVEEEEVPTKLPL